MRKRDVVPLDVHVIRIANRDYNLGEKEKGLTPASMVAKINAISGKKFFS